MGEVEHRPGMDEPKKEAVRRWLEKADHDIKAAEAALPDVACFHAQQCAEKTRALPR